MNFATSVAQGIVALAAFAIFLWITCGWASAESSTFIGSVYIRSGPNGEIQVSTPWGDYAAYDEGGGYFWVGTQREFDRQRVIAISRENGMRLSTVNVDGGDASFVPEGTLRTHVGGVTIDALSPTINFGTTVYDADTHRVTDLRSVDMSWIQAVGEIPQIIIWSAKDRTRYLPGPVDVAGNGWYIANYNIEKKDLSRPVAFIILARGARPTVISVPSIAALDYSVEAKQAQSFVSLGVPVDSKTRKQLAYLRMLDPSIGRQGSTHATRPASTPAPPATMAPRATQAAEVLAAAPQLSDYRGSVTDSLSGQGSIILIFGSGGTANSNGTWSFSFPGKMQRPQDAGAIIGLKRTPYDITFILQGRSPSSCRYDVRAEIESDGTLHGTYGSTTCENSGAFSATTSQP